MHGVKVLIFVAIVGIIGAALLFTFSPETRPPIVKKYIRQWSGLGPAKTPTECMDRFREAIKKRDYETAAEFTDTDYREQMRKVSKGAKKLGDAIDSMLYNMEKNGVNSPKARHILYLLEPFPTTIKVVDLKESDNGNKAIAKISVDAEGLSPDTAPRQDFINRNRHMIRALVPIEIGLNLDTLELFKEETGFWKIRIPVTPRLRTSVDKLKENATNYANGILQVRDEVKNNPVTKEQVVRELESRVADSQ
jgi:hypothetical protein